ncbi:endonuclease I [Corallococcus sp. H22C18031201]|uniref:endonuclease I family protein n=1 Tax=Citreicoccus inhibens TaxID=2849499 RepID=UPI000E762F1E|nr:endonuclease [Citreicoccus inhibens]MBU8896519.1 endonuclease [Citreicoccus inhibens]RJS18767.1 endonuclease I [Corallococcus sp. H22C18031201]
MAILPSRSTTAPRAATPAEARTARPSTQAPAAAKKPQRPVDVFTPAGKDPRYDGLKDQALIRALHDAVSKHKDLGYNQARKVIFTELDNHDGKVKCVYTGREVTTKKIPSSSDMNVEHTWPQSKGATGAAKADLHHLFPTDSKANSIRGNYPFGIVKDVKWSQNGAKFGKDAQGRTVFEPPDEHKGNVARALFYFSTVYSKHIPPEDEAILKQWNKADAVDAAEVSRNDAIEKYQQNRNPFVDDSTLADRIADF